LKSGLKILYKKKGMIIIAKQPAKGTSKDFFIGLLKLLTKVKKSEAINPRM
jgi:hypothetical protein